METKTRHEKATDPREIERRLLDRLVRASSGCWIWTGSKNEKGYGKIGVWNANSDSATYTHRLSYTLFCGLIPDGMFVCHRCDNPACCNPVHLFIGTNEDNVRDMVSKERNSKGESHYLRRNPDRILKGERIASAKLTERLVREIVRRSESGESQADISRDTGMSRASVCLIVNRKVWRHLWE